MSAPDATAKPRMRGVLHQWATLAALVAGAVLVALSASPRQALASAVYAVSLVCLFGVSAAYHRITWDERRRALMRRADHAMIFMLIAGTYTPFMSICVPQPRGMQILGLVWAGAAIGIAQSLFWLKAPKALTAVIAVAVGWCGLFVGRDAYAYIPFASLALLALGGVFFTVGAVCYALKRPNPVPGVFGYHEVFHALTLIATVPHWISVWIVVRA